MPPDPAEAAVPLAEFLRRAVARLRAAGVESAVADARLLAEAALGLDRTALLTGGDRPVAAADQVRLAALIDRRAAREPVSRILGRRGFWTLDLALGPDTLDPRPDSETLVEAALAAFPDPAAPLRVLDLGTGTGCLLLAMLAERPRAWGVGVDLSPRAAAVARANAARNGLADRAAFLAGDWATALAGRFDLVLSNPPYIERAAIADLEPEVRAFDPPRALDGGPDGLDAYRALAAALPGLLAPGGVAVLELGQGQGTAVAALLTTAGLSIASRKCDLAGIERCLVARRV